MTGQLYKVRVWTETLTGEQFNSVIILHAHSQQEVESMVRYFFEVTRQEKYYIKNIEKVRDKFYQLSCHKVEDNPDMVQKLKEGCIARHTPTNQNKNKNCMSLGVAGVMHASSENEAYGRVASYLSDLSRDIHSDNPFFKDGMVVAEELGEVDPTRSAKIESIYKEIRIFTGGAPSLGKR